MILMWGAGSQSRILLEMLDRSDQQVAAIYDPFRTTPTFETSIPFLATQAELIDFLPLADRFAIAIGGEHGLARHQTMKWLDQRGLAPQSIMATNAHLEPSATIGVLAQVMPGVVVHHFAVIGDACILNTGCVIDHETRIGNGVHIMGSAAIAGRVEIGDYACIGTNATILPDIKIGKGAFVGAGAVVTKDVPDWAIFVGNPAKFVRHRKPSAARLPCKPMTPHV